MSKRKKQGLTRGQVEEILGRRMGELMAECGVPHWRVAVVLEKIPDHGLLATVKRRVDYWQATITLDPSKQDDEATLCDSLQHELLHCLLGPFDLVYEAMGAHIQDKAARMAMERLYYWAQEQGVLNISRMLINREDRVMPQADDPIPPIG